MYDFVVSRAVMPLADLMKIIRKNFSTHQQNALPNGLICLKGGELEHETMPFRNKTTMWNLSDYFDEDFLKQKSSIRGRIKNNLPETSNKNKTCTNYENKKI